MVDYIVDYRDKTYQDPDEPFCHVTPYVSLKLFIYISADWLNSSKRIDGIDCTWCSL